MDATHGKIIALESTEDDVVRALVNLQDIWPTVAYVATDGLKPMPIRYLRNQLP